MKKTDIIQILALSCLPEQHGSARIKKPEKDPDSPAVKKAEEKRARKAQKRLAINRA